MARGVGALNVSVGVNTAGAVRNLRSFQGELKAAGAMGRSFANDLVTSSTRAGNAWQRGMAQMKAQNDSWAKGMAALSMKEAPRKFSGEEMARGMNTYRSSIIDLTNETGRYKRLNEELAKSPGILKGMEKAFKGLKAIGKIAIPLAVGAAAFEFGQSVRTHIEYIHSWADAWRELKSVVGLAKSGLELEEERLKEKEERDKKRLDAMDEILKRRKEQQQQIEEDYREEIRSQRHRMNEALHGQAYADWIDNREKYGRSRAATIAAETGKADTAKQVEEDRREAEQKAKEAQARREREAEQRRRAAIRKAEENAKRDAEAVSKLRYKVLDFNKTDLDRERDELLRTLEDPRLRKLAYEYASRLERLTTLKKNRETLANRKGSDSAILDARTADGWAALRDNIRNGPTARMLKKQEEAVEEQRITNGHLANIEQRFVAEEVFTL